jgi:hypothetical protein
MDSLSIERLPQAGLPEALSRPSFRPRPRRGGVFCGVLVCQSRNDKMPESLNYEREFMRR